MNHFEKILLALENSIKANNFVRLTLSKNKNQNDSLKKIIAKLVMIKNKSHLSFTYRHQTKDLTKNILVEESIDMIRTLITDQFEICNLFTTEKDYSLETLPNGKSKLVERQPTFDSVPNRTHDKEKNRLIEGKNYLKALGVLDAKGRIKKDKGDKFKQINKFVEIIDALFRNQPELSKKKKLKVVDMGSGKGYLTFALYDYLTTQLKIDVEVIGVEIRQDLIDLCNKIATEVGFKKLSFEKGLIADYKLEQVDILIALHACDTATDDAIVKGKMANADLIICAPCCHKQIRNEISGSNLLDSVLTHGILKERQAEILTDSIRALLLETAGYKTKIFEFISTEHTGKNLMIVGQKHDQKVDKEKLLSEVKKIKSEFGIKKHYLEDKLGY